MKSTYEFENVAIQIQNNFSLSYGGFPLDNAQEYAIIMTGVTNIEAAISAEYKSNVISPDFNKMN